MVNFGCKKISIEEIFKCGFGLSKTEVKILKNFVDNPQIWFSTFEISEKLNLDLTTIQKATKKLSEKEVLEKTQKNLEKGGYIYEYKSSDRKKIKEIVMIVVRNWSEKVEEEIYNW